MRRLSFLLSLSLLAGLACGESTEPTGSVDVEVTAAARTASYVVRNGTSSSVGVVACDGQVAVARLAADPPTVRVCTGQSSTVTITAGASQPGTIAIAAAGSYRLHVTLSDGTVRSSSTFAVP